MLFSPRYRDCAASILALSKSETDQISLMATMACELFHHFDRFDWVGFYRNVGGKTLKIGPYHGEHGRLTIPFSRGCAEPAPPPKRQLQCLMLRISATTSHAQHRQNQK